MSLLHITVVVTMMVMILLLFHQVLIKHFLVADLVVYLIVQLELHSIDIDLLAILVEVKTVDLLINHLHDLVLIETIEVRCMSAHNSHAILILLTREVISLHIADHVVMIAADDAL